MPSLTTKAHNMPDIEDEDDSVKPGVPDVGMIWGIVVSERSNLRRHEKWAGEQFTSFNSKLDGLRSGQDEIKELLAQQTGTRAAWISISKPVLVLWGAMISGAVSLALHVYFKVTQ
jgi:hypothetical protein